MNKVTYRNLLRKYFVPQKGKVIALTLLLILSIALQILNPQILREFIDLFTKEKEKGELIIYASMFIGIAIINQCVSVLAGYIAQIMSWNAKNELRRDLLAHCTELDMSFHKERTPGEMVERIDGDVSVLGNFFSNFMVLVFTNVIFLSGVLVILFLEHWMIGASLSIVIVIAFFILKWVRGVSAPFWSAVREHSTKFFSNMTEHFTGIDDIKANGAVRFVMDKFYGQLKIWLPAKQKAALSSAIMWTTTIFSLALCNIVAFLVCYYLWDNNVISVGTAFMVFLYTEYLISPLEVLRTQIEDLQMVDVSIKRIQDLLDQSSSIIDGKTEIEKNAQNFSVEYDQVYFSYNDKEKALNNISFHLESGMTLGIIGRTGSGKTTLIHLLLRFKDPQSGSLKVGNRNLKNISVRNLREKIGIVTQDIQFFYGTIRDNLTLYDQSISDIELFEVLGELGVRNLIDSLPNKLDTIIDSSGGMLSAGEAQLLSIVRVFLKKPEIIVLDEASSRLDQATEHLVEKAITKLLHGKTSIIISHRLSTLNRADKILILQNGHIIEEGSRVELVNNKNSRFSRLLKAGNHIEEQSLSEIVL